MLKTALFCAVLVAGVSSFSLLKPQEIIHNVESAVNNAVGNVVGAVGDAMTGVPLFFAQGIHGAGDWLGGIKDKVQQVTDEIELHRRKTLLERYNEAVLHKHEDTTLKFPQLVTKYGYPVEVHEVKTDDGYILTLFRIPYGKHSPLVPGVKRPVVFLMHGLLDCADDWIIIGPEKGLGYKMADAGYDVWLGNARGNTYSKKHVNRVPADLSFWDFDWDEIGRFDLPAMIDFALAKTGQPNLYYVGHSQGTTSFFVMCSMRPEYNAKIRIMFALAPIAWMSHMVSPVIRLVSPMMKGFDWISNILGVGEFLPNQQFSTIAGGILCKNRAITQDICSNSLFLICGYDLDQLNTTMLPIFMGHSPSGSSVRQLLHYGQEVVNKDFRRYDFGEKKNLREYGQRVPPSYDVSKVTAPVSLFYSVNDWLSHPTDVEILGKKLGNMVDKYLVPHPQFNHMDYMWAINVDTLVYDRVINMMRRY